jgi:hypothetical protein
MFHIMINAYWEALAFELPPSEEGGGWRGWIDTPFASVMRPLSDAFVDWARSTGANAISKSRAGQDRLGISSTSPISRPDYAAAS